MIDSIDKGLDYLCSLVARGVEFPDACYEAALKVSSENKYISLDQAYNDLRDSYDRL